MSSLLLSIATAGFLALSSLLVIIFRVSPLSAPAIAIPGVFMTLWLAVACFCTLLSYALWSRLSVEGMDLGRTMTVALREGSFVAMTAVVMLLFQILGILTWWIALLIAAVFLLVEMALLS